MSTPSQSRTNKKKKFKLRAFFKKVFNLRKDKALKAMKPKGITLTGHLKKFDNYVPYRGVKSYINNLRKPARGQRKIRKANRQMNRKAA